MKEQPRQAAPTQQRSAGKRLRPEDSYGLVLLLIVVDYIAVSALYSVKWGRLLIVILLGVTLLFALRTSNARLIWQALALGYLVVSALATLIGILTLGDAEFSQATAVVGGLLLLVTPAAIVRRVIAHRVVTTESVMGAVCVYLLIGFSFTFIYAALGGLSAAPFFAGQTQATANNFLFFSFTTLTTVGYGNLVPAGNLGQTFAMLEALFGQIYLVIIVARLVSLWGSERPRQPSRASVAASPDSAEHTGDAQNAPPDAPRSSEDLGE